MPTWSLLPSRALPERAPRLRALGIVAAVGALALASQIAVPLPGTPVPLTLQPMLVVLAGLLLGPVDAAMAMLAYLAAGAAGLPVFTPIGAPGNARLLGPTGGYLLAYPASAYVAGRLGAGRNYMTRAVACGAGMLVLYAGGLAQLAVLSGGLARAAALGVLPFAAADAVKSLLAAALGGRRPSRQG